MLLWLELMEFPMGLTHILFFLLDLWQVEDPLEQAIKFLQPLQEWGANYIETHLLAFEVYLRKGTYIIHSNSLSIGQ